MGKREQNALLRTTNPVNFDDMWILMPNTATNLLYLHILILLDLNQHGRAAVEWRCGHVLSAFHRQQILALVCAFYKAEVAPL